MNIEQSDAYGYLLAQGQIYRATTPHLMMVCVRRGTAKNTPKNARAADHSSSCDVLNTIGPLGGFCFGDSCDKAGIIPTRPAARGIVAVATAVVCTMTMSVTVNEPKPARWSSLKVPKPRIALCRLPMLIHPVYNFTTAFINFRYGLRYEFLGSCTPFSC